MTVQFINSCLVFYNEPVELKMRQWQHYDNKIDDD